MFNVATYGFIVMCSRINRERTLCSKNSLQHSTFILWCKNKVAVMVVPFLLKYFQNEIKASEFKKKWSCTVAAYIKYCISNARQSALSSYSEIF